MEAGDFNDLHWLLDVIQSTNLGIVVLDSQLRVDVFNRFMQAHSGIAPEQAIGQPITALFPELPEQWLRRRVGSVFELGIPVYTTWEERPCLFHFPLRLPIHHQVDMMYQNIMFVPLRAANDRVERVGIVVYDVTESAHTRRQLEEARVELLRLSRTDRLTGLWSRGYWEERLQQEWQRVQRTGESAALVIFDIDHFKRVNDSHGHPVGDDAIRLVARLLRETAREIDICGRYGGDEFGVILPGATEEGAFTFCERLRAAVAARPIRVRASVLQISISLGLASFTEEVAAPQQWVMRADQALYRAKEAGRNQTQIYR